MKVCVIGDIHGTNKWNECYEKILNQDNDCEKIICLGDWTDPYDDIPFEEQIERYNKFIEDCKKDNRIISILGNHDLATYVINDSTNRTTRIPEHRNKWSELISENLKDSYLVYRIGDYLFSHAGVSQKWLNYIAQFNNGYDTKIMSNTKGWNKIDLNEIVGFWYGDWSNYGNHELQGCTWIRPQALVKCMLKDYNQVVGHTQVSEITSVDVDKVKLWLVDNQRKSEYLTLNIEESE